MKPGIVIRYSTAEIIEAAQAGSTLTLTMSQDDFFAELTLNACRCDHPTPLEKSGDLSRVRLHGEAGLIRLVFDPA